MKKIVSLLLVAAMMLSICAFASAEGPVEITFWHAMGGVNGEAITAMIDDFNAQYEGKIKVNYEYQGAYDDAFAKIKAAGISSIPCDIMQVYDIGTRFMIDQGWAKPMQEFIDAEGFDASVIEPNIAAYYTVDGTLYSMPFNSSTGLGGTVPASSIISVEFSIQLVSLSELWVICWTSLPKVGQP